MSKNYKELAKKILGLVGGKENISFVMHCATRLRFTLVDSSKADEEKLKKLSEVITVLNTNGQFQVVIGNDVPLVFKELNKLGDFGQVSEQETTSDKTGFDKFFEIVSGIFTPIVPILMAAGMAGALLTILSLLNILPDTSPTYYVFNLIKEAGFYFLPIYVSYTAANKLGANPFLAMLLAAILVHPQLSNFEALGVEQLSIFGIGIKSVKYANSVLPAILGTWLLSYVDRFFKKYTPSAIRAFMAPLLTMIVVTPIVLLVIGPLGGYMGDLFGEAVQSLGATFGFVSIAVIAGLMPLMIVTGTHSFVFPLVVATLASNGSESILIPAMMAENLAMAGAAFALSTMTENTDKKAEARAASLSAFLGISEPAMYGVVLPERKAFYSTMIGSLIGGAFAGIFGLTFYTVVSASATGLPGTFGDKGIMNFVVACLTMLISFVATFGLTKILVKEKTDVDIKPGVKETLVAPIEGEMIPLMDVNDKIFASGAMGKGVAFKPNADSITSPVNGRVSSIFQTKHAIGLITESGMEILIHVGIDTVKLNGSHFETFVKVDDQVKVGEQILTFDRKEIEALGYDTTVIMIITNANHYKDIVEMKSGSVTSKDEVLTTV